MSIEYKWVVYTIDENADEVELGEYDDLVEVTGEAALGEGHKVYLERVKDEEYNLATYCNINLSGYNDKPVLPECFKNVDGVPTTLVPQKYRMQFHQWAAENF